MIKKIKCSVSLFALVSTLTSCVMIPSYNPPVYKALLNKPKYFSKNYCVVEKKDIRPWDYNANYLETPPCVNEVDILHDTSTTVIGTVTKQNSYKIINSKIIYDSSYIEFIILNGQLAGKIARMHVPAEADKVYLP